MTLKQIRDYIRYETGQLDSKLLMDAQINLYINQAMRKVQSDLSPHNLNEFLKKIQSSVTAGIITAPTDLSTNADAIQLVTLSGGTKSTITGKIGTTTQSEDIFEIDATITAVTPGITYNGWAFTFAGGTALGITVNTTNKTVLINWQNGVTIVNDLQTYINSNLLLSSLFSIVLTADTKALTKVTTPAPFLTAGATGTGFVVARNLTIGEFIKFQPNTISAPTLTEPAFCIQGNTSGVKVINVLPSTITYAEIIYKFVVADLTADTDSLVFSTEQEEAIIIKILERVYKFLKMPDKEQQQAADYSNKIKDVLQAYETKEMTDTKYKVKIKSNDQ